jgi:hypothetical protein
MEIFFQMLNGLDEDTRKNLYFILKSKYDARTLRQYPSKEWEDLWIKSLGDNSKIVTVVSCFVCQQEYPTLIDITETVNLFARGFRDTICEKCNNNANATLFTRHPKQLLKMTVINKEELFGTK